MPLIASIAMVVLLVSTCAAAIGAVEARRMSDLRGFRIALACTVPLSLLMVALLVAIGLPNPFAQSDHVGFGPGWHCLGSSARGGSFCVREIGRPAANSP